MFKLDDRRYRSKSLVLGMLALKYALLPAQRHIAAANEQGRPVAPQLWNAFCEAQEKLQQVNEQQPARVWSGVEALVRVSSSLSPLQDGLRVRVTCWRVECTIYISFNSSTLDNIQHRAPMEITPGHVTHRC
jgi:hypothetical protein